MAQHEAIVSPGVGEKETIQVRVPAWIWRQTKSIAALRPEYTAPGELIAEALIAHFGFKPEVTETTRKVRKAS